MQFIRHYLDPSGQLSQADWQQLAPKFIPAQLPTKATLLVAGQIENQLSIVEQGTLRFFIPQEDKDITFAFVFDHEFFCAYDSFLTRTPSFCQIEALTPARIWSISYVDLQQVYTTTQSGNYLGRLAAEQLYLKKIQRERSLLQDSAEQRYLNLLTNSPRLVQQIPHKYLASYIGITPQALSRIRRRIY